MKLLNRIKCWWAHKWKPVLSGSRWDHYQCTRCGIGEARHDSAWAYCVIRYTPAEMEEMKSKSRRTVHEVLDEMCRREDPANTLLRLVK